MNKLNPTSQKESIDPVTQKYESARVNLLLVIVLTVANIVSAFLGSDSMLLFSATIPYYSVIIGMRSSATPLMLGCYVVAATTLAAYFMCWMFSKKNVGWLVGALVLFVVDTAALAYLYISAGDASGILDAIIHAWVMYYLIIGIKNGKMMGKQDPDDTHMGDGM